MWDVDMRIYVTRAINLLVGIAAIILGLRILFRLFDANPTAGFVNWIYDTSSVLMEPFRGVFSPVTIERGVTLDFSAMFSLVMYMVIGFLIVGLIGLIPEARTVRTTRR